MTNTPTGMGGAPSREEHIPCREKPAMSHRRTILAASGALLCLALAGSAGASVPEPHPGYGPADQERPCFMVRAHWNVGLDGPQPTC
ncbi:hypothetical protein I601_3013 [Nocardioides dokdonensis FR1436]|uniref:Uncharacterized protein n=2 Tax=Nocardioides TaxID=1839 RepID=A0A1A9GMB5_9ACTN|nr:hypothetical protein I601_3013 [Nocardioides dokdonensis FR1436]